MTNIKPCKEKTQAYLATYIAVVSASSKKASHKCFKLDEMQCHCRTGSLCLRKDCQLFPQRSELVRAIERYRLEGHAKRENRLGYEKINPFEATCTALADEWLFLRYGVPTFKTVQRRRKAVVKHMAKEGKEPMQKCHELQPCQLWCCPVCRRLHQLRLLAALCLRGQHTKKWTSITVVPEYGQCPMSKQPLGSLGKFTRRIRETLEKAAPRMKGLFVIEVSVDRAPSGEATCQWHVHGLMRSISRKEYREIKRAFAWKKSSCKAVRKSKAGDVIGWLGYASKSEIFARHYRQSEEDGGFSKATANLRDEACVVEALKTRRVGKRSFAVRMNRWEVSRS